MIDRSTWQWFRVGDLFPPQKCKCSNATELLEDGDEIAYIGAKKSDNGVMRYVKREEKLVSRGNCIVFIGDGQGSVGYCLYQPVDFIGSTTLIAGYNEHLNPYNAAFLVSILDQERFRYSFGRKYKKEVIANTIIQLPAIEHDNGDYEPDWQYMEDFIKDRIIPQIPKKAQKVWLQKYDTKPIQHEKIQLNTNEWEWFVVKDIFDVKAGKYHYKEEYEDGETPYLSATAVHNGVGGRINLSPEFEGGVVTTEKVGCTSFYQPVPFCATSDVNILRRKDGIIINAYVGLFLASVINFNESFRWTYGRQCRVNDTENIRLKLPAVKRIINGEEVIEPDWQFMEDYIKSLPYSKNLEPSDPNEKVDELMEVKKELIKLQQAVQTQKSAQIINYGTINNDNSKHITIK